MCAASFGVFIIGLGIPVFCVISRYNLYVGGVCSDGWATFWGGIFPWIVSWMLYQGHAILGLLSWTGLVLNGFIDFICPMLIAYVAAKAARRALANMWLHPDAEAVTSPSLVSKPPFLQESLLLNVRHS